MPTINSTTVVHGPSGPVWLTAGDTIPGELVELIRADLIQLAPENSVPVEPQGAGANSGEDEAAGKTNVEPRGTGGTSGKEESNSQEKAGVPFATYPLEKWAAYATGLGLDVTGEKKADVITAIAEHFVINTEGMNPAAVIVAIQEAAKK